MPRRSERGVSLIALMVVVTFMIIASAIMLPSWDYVIRNDKEEQLLFAGYQVVDAIARCQGSPKGAGTSLEDLVKKRCLRKAYAVDPLTKKKWRILGPGPAGVPATPGTTYMGPMAGVGTNGKGKSLRRLNGKEKYEEWEFRPALVPPGAPAGMAPQKEWRFMGGRPFRVPTQVPRGVPTPRT